MFRDLAHAKDSTAVLIPGVKNGDINESAYVLRALNVPGNSSSIPYSAQPLWGKASCTDSYADLKTTKMNKKLVPNVLNMGAKDAVYLLESYGLKVRITGIAK